MAQISKMFKDEYPYQISLLAPRMEKLLRQSLKDFTICFEFDKWRVSCRGRFADIRYSVLMDAFERDCYMAIESEVRRAILQLLPPSKEQLYTNALNESLRRRHG